MFTRGYFRMIVGTNLNFDGGFHSHGGSPSSPSSCRLVFSLNTKPSIGVSIARGVPPQFSSSISNDGDIFPNKNHISTIQLWGTPYWWTPPCFQVFFVAKLLGTSPISSGILGSNKKSKAASGSLAVTAAATWTSSYGATSLEGFFCEGSEKKDGWWIGVPRCEPWCWNIYLQNLGRFSGKCR